VGLRQFSRCVDLGKIDLLLWAMQRTPRLDVALQRAQLTRLIASRLLDAEQLEEGLGLQRTVALELRNDPGPVVGEGSLTRPVGAWALELAGQCPGLFVLASGSLTHPRMGRRLDLGAAFPTFSQQELYLGVFLHGVLPLFLRGQNLMVQSPPAVCRD